MSNPNFVSDLVAMAKAFEELPEVKAELQQVQGHLNDALGMVQHREESIVRLKAELDAAHAATRKAEVERDHAERMFLETDDRLNAFRRLVQAFDTDVKSLVQAAEPEPEVKPEDLSSVVEQMNAVAEPEPTAEPNDKLKDVISGYPYGDPGPAIGGAFEGQGDADPTLAVSTGSSHTDSSDGTAPTAEPSSATVHEAVSVQSDPTPATPDAQHSPVGSSASAGESNATTETAGSTQHEEAPQERPTDPTAAATPTETGADAASTGASENVTASAPTTTEQPSTSSNANVDDVGYHNEPKIGPAGGPEAWHDWDNWCSRMNRKYGGGSWPARPTLHGDREAAAQ